MEGEGRDMAVQEGLDGLGRIGLDEAAVAVGQVDDETVGLPLHATDDHQSLAEVALRVARRVGQRHEHLLGLTAMLSDVVLDGGVSAVEPVLVPEALEYPLGRVALPLGTREVILQDGVNHPGEGLKLGPAGWVLPPVTWRYRPGQHLAHRVPVQAKHPGTLPERSSLPPYRPGERARTAPHGTSINTFQRLILSLTKGGGRYVFKPPQIKQSIRPRGPLYLRRLQFWLFRGLLS